MTERSRRGAVFVIEQSREQDPEDTDPSRVERRAVPMLVGMWDLADDEDNIDGVDIRALQAGTVVIADTLNSRYRFVVLFDPSAVLVEGGAMFHEHAVVRLVGATGGGSAVKVGWIAVGLGIEMQRGSVCIRSSPVRSVRIEDVLPSIWHSFSQGAIA